MDVIKHICIRTVSLIALMSMFSTLAKAETFVLAPGPASAIQDLIDNVVTDGDVIQLEAGDFLVSSAVTLKGLSITIRGAVDSKGAPLSRLVGDKTSGILACLNNETAKTIFEDLVVTNGSIDLGGGVLIIDASPTLRRVRLIDNSASVFGGGVAVFGAPSSPVFEECTFENNRANLVGGGSLNGTSATPVYRQCSWSGNEAGLYGREVYNQVDSFPTLSDCLVESCCGVVPPESFIDAGGNAIEATCEDCSGDTNCYGGVNAVDLGVLLSAWGSVGSIYDLDGDGTVGGGDIGILMSQWGDCQGF